MSGKDVARRTRVAVYFDGVDISESVEQYLLSLSYSDAEDEETDDLQIVLQDADGMWLEKWLDAAIQAAAQAGVGKQAFGVGENEAAAGSEYKVTDRQGLIVRESASTRGRRLGSLAYGTVVTVLRIAGEWATIAYGGGQGFVCEDGLSPVRAREAASGGGLHIGDTVTVTGVPQYTSYGEGRPGAAVTNYTGTVTYLNLSPGVPYPVHVGRLGWFAEAAVLGYSGESPFEPTTGTASRGLRIQAAVSLSNAKGDGGEQLLDCGQFELDAVTAAGPPSTVTIKGTSLPYSGAVRQTKKNKAWERYTLQGIADEIARGGGMACLYLAAENPLYGRVEQRMQSDIAFLQKLCHDAGMTLKVTNNILVVFDATLYEGTDAVRTIKRGKDGGYSRYRLQTGENNAYTSCRVSYSDGRRTVSATAYIEDYDEDSEKNQCLEIRQKVASSAEAKALAERLLRLHNKYEITASFSFPGDPELLTGKTVALQGWGAWNGSYIISFSRHTVSRGGYSTEIELRKLVSGAWSDSGAGAQGGSGGGKTVDELAREVIRGDWGNGEERRRRLTEAGYDYSAVQKRVNQLLGIRN